MNVHRMFATTDADGKLHLTIPAPPGEYEVAVVVNRRPVQNLPADRPPTPEELGWPPGFLERTYGSIEDETFEAPPRGPVRPVEPLD